MLQHLGIAPGDKIAIEKLPGGRLSLQAAKPAGTIEDFIGLLAGRTDRVATFEDIEAAISGGWAGLVGEE